MWKGSLCIVLFIENLKHFHIYSFYYLRSQCKCFFLFNLRNYALVLNFCLIFQRHYHFAFPLFFSVFLYGLIRPIGVFYWLQGRGDTNTLRHRFRQLPHHRPHHLRCNYQLQYATIIIYRDSIHIMFQHPYLITIEAAQRGISTSIINR